MRATCRFIIGVLVAGAAVGFISIGSSGASSTRAGGACELDSGAGFAATDDRCIGFLVEPFTVSPGDTVQVTARQVCSDPSDPLELDYYGLVDTSDVEWSQRAPDQILARGASGDYLTATVPVADDASDGFHYMYVRCGTFDDTGNAISGSFTVASGTTTTVTAPTDQGGSGIEGDSISVVPVTGEQGDDLAVKPFEVDCGVDPATLVFFADYPDLSDPKEIGTFASGEQPEFDFTVPDDANDPSAFATICADGATHWTQPWGTTLIAGIQGGAGPAGPVDFDVPHDRSSFSASLATPSEVDMAPEHVLSNLIVALLLLLLLFPAEMFNATFEENYDEITAWLRGPRGWNEKASGWLGGRGTAIGFGIVCALAALLYAFLDPDVAVDQASLALVIGIGASITAGVFLAARVARQHVAATTEDQGRLRVYPAALFVALVCVVISRVVNFEPGYLYGVVAGIAFTVELSKEDDGRVAARVAVAALLTSFAAWLLWVPVQAMASDPNPALPVLILDAFLAAVFVGGVQGVVFGFVPMRFLPGAKVWAWSKKAWLLIEGVAAFAFVQILIHPTQDYDGNLNKMVILFVGFGALSTGFWAYFRNRANKDAAAIEEPAVEEPQER